MEVKTSGNRFDRIRQERNWGRLCAHWGIISYARAEYVDNGTYEATDVVAQDFVWARASFDRDGIRVRNMDTDRERERADGQTLQGLQDISHAR
jgi:hypothetical protein